MHPLIESKGLGRREAMKRFAYITSAVSSLALFDGLSPEAIFATGREIHSHLLPQGGLETPQQPLLLFKPQQNATLIVLSELIIPETRTPGAKTARVNEFIDVFLASRPKADQDEFINGLEWLDRRSLELYGKGFADSAPEQQRDLLTRLSRVDSTEGQEGKRFFELAKTLTVVGYYTSKVGIEDELKFDGWIEYKGCTHPEHRHPLDSGEAVK
ncbi:MAG: gluconate 2-dehydrogenase subunit 3 family protein [Terriglobia bacterium]